MVRLEGFGSLSFVTALYRPLICKGTDGHALQGRLVSSYTGKGKRHREIKDCDRGAQGVSSSVQELTVLIFSHSWSSLQQCIVKNSLFGAHPCNFQSNSPVIGLPASHKGNHSTENTTTPKASFL